MQELPINDQTSQAVLFHEIRVSKLFLKLKGLVKYSDQVNDEYDKIFISI